MSRLELAQSLDVFFQQSSRISHGSFTMRDLTVVVDQCWFLQRARIACNAERCIATAIPSARPSHAGTLSRWMKIASCGLHCEVAKTLLFSGTNNGWGRRALPLKICAQSDPPPLKSADFDHAISAYNVWTVRSSEKVQLSRIGKSTKHFATSYRWSRTLPLTPPKGGSKSELVV